MSNYLELTIIAQSEDDFDDLCCRAAALFGVTLWARRGKGDFSGKLIVEYRYDEAKLQVKLLLDAEVARILEISISGRDTLVALESLIQH